MEFDAFPQLEGVHEPVVLGLGNIGGEHGNNIDAARLEAHEGVEDLDAHLRRFAVGGMYGVERDRVSAPAEGEDVAAPARPAAYGPPATAARDPEQGRAGERRPAQLEEATPIYGPHAVVRHSLSQYPYEPLGNTRRNQAVRLEGAKAGHNGAPVHYTGDRSRAASDVERSKLSLSGPVHEQEGARWHSEGSLSGRMR